MGGAPQGMPSFLVIDGCPDPCGLPICERANLRVGKERIGIAGKRKLSYGNMAVTDSR